MLTCDGKVNAKIVHELTQSLMVIHAYVTGCEQRLKEGALAHEQLSQVFEKINQQVALMSHKIHNMD